MQAPHKIEIKIEDGNLVVSGLHDSETLNFVSNIGDGTVLKTFLRLEGNSQFYIQLSNVISFSCQSVYGRNIVREVVVTNGPNLPNRLREFGFRADEEALNLTSDSENTMLLQFFPIVGADFGAICESLEAFEKSEAPIR